MISHRYTIKTVSVLLSATIMYACNEKIDTPEYTDDSNRIVVKTEVEGQTKAGYEGTTALPSEFVMDIIQGDDQNYNYSLIRMTKEDTGNTYKSPEGTVLLWADSDHSNTSVKAMTIPAGMTSVDAENPMKISVCTDQTTEDKVKESDLLGATSENGISIVEDEINITFNHMMAKLNVNCHFQNESNDVSIDVESMTLENICITGGFSYSEMDFDNTVSKEYGNINMYMDKEENTGEAIFYPYIPTENPVLVIKTTINGTKKEFRCPISLKSKEGFLSGNRYIMNVIIAGTTISNSTITIVKEWNIKNDEIETTGGESVLWLGTSISAGDIIHGDSGTTDLGSNNYPKMVADALGFNLYNNSRGSSFVCFYPSNEDGTDTWAGKDWSEYSDQVWKGYSLSATHAQIDEKFVPLGVPEWLINSFKRHSYETLILPYIDGTIASCSTVIIDHCYNDRRKILDECSWHPGDDEIQFQMGSGWDWLVNLGNSRITESEQFFQGEWWNSAGRKNSYFGAIIHLVKKIWEVNPRIKIVFGGYFAWKSPVFGSEFGNDNYCNFICQSNKSISEWLRVPFVDVYNYTGIHNVNINGTSDFSKFCPDGVHPHSDTTGESNRIIAGIYINELNGIISTDK